MPYIDGYTKQDGTQVREHHRWAPGARREMTALAVTALLVWGAGSGQLTVEMAGAEGPAAAQPGSAAVQR